MTLYIAHSTLQGTLLKTLVEAKPTLFFGVPRVYEKIQEKMMEVSKWPGIILVLDGQRFYCT